MLLQVDVQTSFESDRWFTQEEFAMWVLGRTSDLERFELMNGRIVMTPPSGWPQGESSASVAALLTGWIKPRGLGRVFGADQGFELPSGDTVSPDASFVSAERWATSEPHEHGKFLRVVPDLVVEVLSTTTASRDRGEKKAIYERNGVREYLLVDVRVRKITRCVLEGGRYGVPRDFLDEETFESKVLEGFRFPVAEAMA
jgi:Uma2 family endonuclease